jgi:hypothetical protein
MFNLSFASIAVLYFSSLVQQFSNACCESRWWNYNSYRQIDFGIILSFSSSTFKTDLEEGKNKSRGHRSQDLNRAHGNHSFLLDRARET